MSNKHAVLLQTVVEKEGEIFLTVHFLQTICKVNLMFGVGRGCVSSPHI
jgi:hypothetical protein